MEGHGVLDYVDVVFRDYHTLCIGALKYSPYLYAIRCFVLQDDSTHNNIIIMKHFFHCYLYNNIY